MQSLVLLNDFDWQEYWHSKTNLIFDYSANIPILPPLLSSSIPLVQNHRRTPTGLEIIFQYTQFLKQ